MLPVQKHSKSRKRKRRSHQALKPIHYVRCAQCGNAKLPHCACENCGFVRQHVRDVVDGTMNPPSGGLFLQPD